VVVVGVMRGGVAGRKAVVGEERRSWKEKGGGNHMGWVGE